MLTQLKSKFGDVVKELNNAFQTAPDYTTAINNMNNMAANNPQLKPSLDTIINSINALQLSDDQMKLQILKELIK